MKLTISQIKYMMVLDELDQGAKIRCTDVAKRMQVKKPSVCGMLCRLESMGLVQQDHYSDVRITEKGRELMQECRAYYDNIYGLLQTRLGLSETSANAAAFALMGNVTASVLEEIVSQTKKEEVLV